MSEIGQESTFTCKLKELPPGTSKKVFNTLFKTKKIQKIKIIVYEKQYTKDVFFLRRLLMGLIATSAFISVKSKQSSLWGSGCYS